MFCLRGMIFVDKIRENLLPSPLLDFQGTRILYGSIHPTRSFLDFFHYALLFITLSEAKHPLRGSLNKITQQQPQQFSCRGCFLYIIIVLFMPSLQKRR